MWPSSYTKEENDEVHRFGSWTSQPCGSLPRFRRYGASNGPFARYSSSNHQFPQCSEHVPCS